MLNNLTDAFLTAMNQQTRRPIQLLQFQFESPVGWKYLSDRDIVVGGRAYEGLVENWGSLSTVNSENAVSSTQQLSITIWNGGSDPFSDYFQQVDPVNTRVTVYQTFEGLSTADMALIGDFVIQDPIEYGEASRLLTLDLVSVNMRYFGQVGKLLNSDDYPSALESDLNKPINLIVGNAGEMRCLCSKKPPTATLKGSFLTKAHIHINFYDNLYDQGFPNAGYIQVDEEIMYYNGRNASQLYITHRNRFGTANTDHSDGALVFLIKDSANRWITTEYIIGAGPLSSVSNVKVGGYATDLVLNQDYSIHLGSKLDDPAKIIFNQQPTFRDYSRGARFKDENFDTVNYDANSVHWNTHSWGAYRAIGEANRSTGAILNKSFRKLAIKQTTPQIPDGEIVGLFVRVDHWATNAYSKDQAVLYVDGIKGGHEGGWGIGRLTRPNAQDILDLGGEVDLWHDHDHDTGGTDHGHVNKDVDFDYSNVTHDHGVSIFNNSTWPGTPTIAESVQNGTTTSKWVYADCTFNNIKSRGDIVKVRGTVTLKTGGTYNTVVVELANKEVGAVFETVVTGQTVNFEFSTPIVWGTNTKSSVKCRVKSWAKRLGAAGAAKVTISNMILDVTAIEGATDGKVNPLAKSTPVAGNVTTVKANSTPVSIKNINDVKPPKDAYGTPYNQYNPETVDINIKKNSSRSVAQRFNLTPYIDSIDWSWLNQKLVRIDYQGSAETVDVIITHMTFEIEYRQAKLTQTDLVTCSAVGSINSRPDAVIQYLLNTRAGVPLSLMGSVERERPTWYDTNTWADQEVWEDLGETAIVPAGAIFEEAAAYFAKTRYRGTYSYNYHLDGVIPGNLSVKDAIEKITWQTRSKLLWQHGKCKLVVKRESSDWLIVKDVPTTKIQLRSYTAKRTSVDDIANAIQIFHTIDRLSSASGSEQYQGDVVRRDEKSIRKHGERVKDDLWEFDLLRSWQIASDVADYYIWLLGETYTIYGLTTYLPNFDIEKDDYISINSQGFDVIKKLKTEVAEITREFGSGKNGKINTLKYLVRSIRQKFFRDSPKDQVDIFDSRIVSIEQFADIADFITAYDTVQTDEGKLLHDTTELTDYIDTVSEYNSKFASEAQMASNVRTDHTTEVFSSVEMRSVIGPQLRLCFGACGFGTLPFGSKTEFESVNAEFMDVSDVVLISTGMFEEEEIEITDFVFSSDGYGSPRMGDGFGAVPFGY